MDDWRPVVAALADPERRLLLARVTVEAARGLPLHPEAMPTADRRRLVALVRAGLVELRAGGAHPVDAFTPLLGSTSAATGIGRYVSQGRIVGWPRRPSDRQAVLAWAADAVLAPGEEVDERTITDRLRALWTDPVLLRRDMVDAGLVARAADGSAYRRAPA
ncbi:DUF2087 domain-containing protein [Agrococcus sp. SGAir0287]|uniref:DUF2087 domain-containing protein n=1 Tax=Agrococcus sp. SGAir0287 TaxID=2070347 RepID=UPI0010CCDC16|nr:DUF2087 domain-containing protein [Agrococcus sp. SGAir0287]QCR20358.1 hypothetical protein C1N71_13655 [Agrococcus sp. SGAir0287]